MKKSLPEKVKNYIVVVLLLVVLVAIEIVCIQNFTWAKEWIEDTITAEEMAQRTTINEYAVEGDLYTPTVSMPKLWLNTSVNQIATIRFDFAENISSDTNYAVYYISRNGVLQEDKVNCGVISAGSSTFEVEADQETFDAICLIIDGSFRISAISIIGNTYVSNRGLFAAFLALFGVLEVALAVYGIFFWKHAYQNALGFWHGANLWICKAGKKLHLNLVRVYVILALVLGITYSFLIPYAQIPDEPAHLNTMVSSIGMDGVFDQYANVTYELDSFGSIQTELAAHNLKEYLKASMIRFDKSKITAPCRISLEVLNYLPMMAGFLTGYVLNMPILWCMQLAELFGLLYAVALGYCALKLMPVKRELLCAVMLLPMNIQQCASVNYDAVLLPLCYLLIAYIFHLKYREKKVGWISLIPIVIITLLIMKIKILYILLALFIFVIPMKHFELKVGKINLTDIAIRHRVLWYILVALVFVAGCFVVRNNVFISAVRAILVNPVDGMKLLYHTVMINKGFYLNSMIGRFGWLDTPLSNKYVLYVLISLLLLGFVGNEKEKQLHVFPRVVLFVVSAFIAFLIIVCMLSWTYYLNGISYNSFRDMADALSQITMIEGAQGRYFLPLLPGVILILDGILKIEKENLVLYQVVYYVLLFVVPVSTIVNRYWV